MRRIGIAAAIVTGVALFGALSLVALAAKERDDRFCVSCHLHDEKFTRLITSSATDLAGSHHQKKVEVGCIACHGGANPAMRLKVWVVAGFDTLRFLAGTYTEPTHMRLPLRNAECRQCHTPILPARRSTAALAGPAQPASTAKPSTFDPSDESTFAAETQMEGRGGTSYHAIREHDPVKTACISCHTSHTTDSDHENRFISKAKVVPICRECHKDI